MEFGMCVKHDYNGHKSGKLEGLEKHHHGTCAIELDKVQLGTFNNNNKDNNFSPKSMDFAT